MCNYCQYDYEDGCKCFLHLINHHAWIDIDKHELVVKYGTNIYRTTITHCPKCGRDLSEDKK